MSDAGSDGGAAAAPADDNAAAVGEFLASTTALPGNLIDVTLDTIRNNRELARALRALAKRLDTELSFAVDLRRVARIVMRTAKRFPGMSSASVAMYTAARKAKASGRRRKLRRLDGSMVGDASPQDMERCVFPESSAKPILSLFIAFP